MNWKLNWIILSVLALKRSMIRINNRNCFCGEAENRVFDRSECECEIVLFFDDFDSCM